MLLSCALSTTTNTTTTTTATTTATTATAGATNNNNHSGMSPLTPLSRTLLAKGHACSLITMCLSTSTYVGFEEHAGKGEAWTECSSPSREKLTRYCSKQGGLDGRAEYMFALPVSA